MSEYRGLGRNKKRPGVYVIVNVHTQQCYIGGSLDCSNRFTFHRYMLRRNQHSCNKLQELWNRDGESSFHFLIIEDTVYDQQVVRQCEQKWLELEPDSTLLNQNRSWMGGSSIPSDARKAPARKIWDRPGYRQDFLSSRDQHGKFKGTAAR